jgi:uncharacterized protein YfaP (DUF2135 family)
MLSLVTTTSSVVTSITAKGFSVYENITHRVSIQYPCGWNMHELLNNDFTSVVMFLIPTESPFSTQEDSETILGKIKNIMYNQPSTTVVVSIKSFPVHPLRITLCMRSFFLPHIL